MTRLYFKWYPTYNTHTHTRFQTASTYLVCVGESGCEVSDRVMGGAYRVRVCSSAVR